MCVFRFCAKLALIFPRKKQRRSWKIACESCSIATVGQARGSVPHLTSVSELPSFEFLLAQIQIASVSSAGVEIGEPFEVSTYWGYEGFKHTEYHGIKK